MFRECHRLNELSLSQYSNVLFLHGRPIWPVSQHLWNRWASACTPAHMGFPVAADTFDFSVRDGFYSSINVADNIHLGYSHFYAEVVRVKQAAEAAASGMRLVLMFDELFKGTNVKDAYDGTLAVTEGFAEYSSVSLCSVHAHYRSSWSIEASFRIYSSVICQQSWKDLYHNTLILWGRSYRRSPGYDDHKNEGILELINS